MKLFAGLSRTDYEEVFRAVGALIDERGWSNVSLMEVDEGLIVQVMAKPTLRQSRPHLETYLLTDADLERIQRDAIRRRWREEAPPSPCPPEPVVRASTPPADDAIPAPALPPSHPRAGRMVEEHHATVVAQDPEGRGAVNGAQASPAEEEPLPPMPDLYGLPVERGLGAVEAFDESADTPWPDTPRAEEDAPMRFIPLETAAPAYDVGAARAAVVMAHIVAARIKSGVPLSGDDPDLASLLEQVRALDDAGIGKG